MSKYYLQFSSSAHCFCLFRGEFNYIICWVSFYSCVRNRIRLSNCCLNWTWLDFHLNFWRLDFGPLELVEDFLFRVVIFFDNSFLAIFVTFDFTRAKGLHHSRVPLWVSATWLSMLNTHTDLEQSFSLQRSIVFLDLPTDLLRFFARCDGPRVLTHLVCGKELPPKAAEKFQGFR